MGTQITPLLKTEDISFEDLRGKVLVVDAFNILYQFLSSLRMRDGTPLKDSKGNVTSHLNGLFLRSTNLMKRGMKLVFVFDGEHPELKAKEIERRKGLKEKARVKYDDAVEKEDIEAMRKYSMQTTSLTKDMVKEAKELLGALGIPVIQAPSEGEAQAAYMVKKNDADYVVSQDTDALLFGATNIVRNLTVSQKKKKANTLSYETIKPQKINLAENLNHLGIDNDQLIVLSMLVGTDFNIGGIKGIGPKKGLKIVREESDMDKIFKDLDWDSFFEYPWTDVFYLFKNIPTTDDYDLEWHIPDKDKIIEILHERHEFNRERIEKEIDNLIKDKEAKQQKGLGDFF
jgi:flap endonuclease-1